MRRREFARVRDAPAYLTGAIDRRAFLAISFAALGPAAGASDGGPPIIGMLANGSARSSAILVDALMLGLREHGLAEARDYSLDVRWAEGDVAQFDRLAEELVRRKPKALLGSTVAAVRALQAATTSIPIVMTTVADPVGTGLIVSLARPGRNTTGLTTLNEDVTPKVSEVIRAVLPNSEKVA